MKFASYLSNGAFLYKKFNVKEKKFHQSFTPVTVFCIIQVNLKNQFIQMRCSRDSRVQKQSKIDGLLSNVVYLRNKSWLNLSKLSQAISELSQTTKMKQDTPSQMFGRVLNMSLSMLSVIFKRLQRISGFLMLQ